MCCAYVLVSLILLNLLNACAVQTLSKLGGRKFADALHSVYLVETSDALRDVQRDKLNIWSSPGRDFQWRDTIEGIPIGEASLTS